MSGHGLGRCAVREGNWKAERESIRGHFTLGHGIVCQ